MPPRLTEYKRSDMAEGRSWANLAAKQPAAVEPKAPEAPPAPEKTVAVIDANVIIGGSSPVGLAEELVTTPDVHSEVRDKQSKQALTTLPFGIRVQEPSEESLAAGTALACPSLALG